MYDYIVQWSKAHAKNIDKAQNHHPSVLKKIVSKWENYNKNSGIYFLNYKSLVYATQVIKTFGYFILYYIVKKIPTHSEINKIFIIKHLQQKSEINMSIKRTMYKNNFVFLY